MLSSSLDTLSKLSKTTYPQKLFSNDCVTLYSVMQSDGNRFCGDVVLDILTGHLAVKTSFKSKYIKINKCSDFH